MGDVTIYLQISVFEYHPRCTSWGGGRRDRAGVHRGSRTGLVGAETDYESVSSISCALRKMFAAILAKIVLSWPGVGLL